MSQVQVEIVPGHIFDIGDTCVVGIPFNGLNTEDVVFRSLGGLYHYHHSVDVEDFLPEYKRFHGLYIAYHVVNGKADRGHPGDGPAFVFCQNVEDPSTEVMLTLDKSSPGHAKQPWDEKGERHNEALNPIGMAEMKWVLKVPSALAAGTYEFHLTTREEVEQTRSQSAVSGLYEHIDPIGPSEKFSFTSFGRASMVLTSKWVIKEFFPKSEIV